MSKAETATAAGTSPQYRQWLQRERRGRNTVRATQLAILLVFLVLWEVLPKAHIMNPLLTSYPSALWPTFLAGTNFVMHSAGWLESALVSCYEKFVTDVELLRMLYHVFQPLEINEETLAFSAHQEVGQGGHFLGAVHTLERFRECFYRPLVSSTENYERWNRNGGRDTATRANDIWKKTLEEYEEPPMDEALKEELKAYVDRRRTELGD